MFLMISVICFSGPEIAIGQDGINAPNSAASLRVKYTILQKELSHNQFQRPLHLNSGVRTDDLRGEIYAVVDHPFSVVSSALKGAPQWCDILHLHLNIKYCRAEPDKSRRKLSVYIGRKYEQTLKQASHVEFVFNADNKAPDFLRVLLNADTGPFSTRNYRIMLEAIPVESGRTFIHLSYSYEAGIAATLALQAYLRTFGSDKVGFTVIGKKPDGRQVYAGGMRGVVERNTMRYYLAIDAYLNALSLPSDRQLETRLKNWFSATERYPLQLHEMAQSEYMTMKRKEYQRQMTEP